MKQKSILCFLWFLQGPGLGFEFVEVFGLTVVFSVSFTLQAYLCYRIYMGIIVYEP